MVISLTSPRGIAIAFTGFAGIVGAFGRGRLGPENSHAWLGFWTMIEFGLATLFAALLPTVLHHLSDGDWPERVPNRGLWVAIDGTRVVHKWRETLPGTPPSGRHYHYDGISEFNYAGGGEWDFMFGLPDVVGLQQAYARWRENGLEKVYGAVYPDM